MLLKYPSGNTDDEKEWTKNRGGLLASNLLHNFLPLNHKLLTTSVPQGDPCNHQD